MLWAGVGPATAGQATFTSMAGAVVSMAREPRVNVLRCTSRRLQAPHETCRHLCAHTCICPPYPNEFTPPCGHAKPSTKDTVKQEHCT